MLAEYLAVAQDTLGQRRTLCRTPCPALFPLYFRRRTHHTPFGLYINIREEVRGGTVYGQHCMPACGPKGVQETVSKRAPLSKQSAQHARYPQTCAGKLSNTTPEIRKCKHAFIVSVGGLPRPSTELICSMCWHKNKTLYRIDLLHVLAQK